MSKRTEHTAQLRKQAAFYRAQAGFSYQRVYALEDENKALREEVAALRARVVVVPERLGTTTSQGLMDVMTLHHHLGWNACLDELARLNGKVVSEGLLRDLLKSAQKLSDRAAGFAVSGVEFAEIGDNNSAIVELEVMLDELRALLEQKEG